ncbi:type I-F CRISPR-associated endoribonuclease Cas6/Csy4 [Arsenophonus nasoniae]|uniref:type I-F CRISPR-associated endoribonuclease Cas6/Csy4 n=1 Tax=Arsenophonus nasoniae TaxID=638 RepID=UPI0038790498
MNHYIEVTLIETDDFPLYQLWSTVYMQLHIAFVEIKVPNGKIPIGLSFPQYYFNQEKNISFMGNKLRLFAQTEAEFKKLNLTKWLARLMDYVHITTIRSVPAHKVTGYAIYNRKQVKSNAERLARHRAKRGDIDYDEALKRYQNVVTTTCLPYIQLESLSLSNNNKHRFKLFITKNNTERTNTQIFSTYGLSSISSVP